LDKQWHHNFETRFDGSTWDPIDLRLKPGRVEEKIGKGKTRCDPVDPARLGQKSSCNSLIFVGDPVIRSKPEIQILNRVESKNYTETLLEVNSRSLLYILPVVSSSLQLEFPITKFTQISTNVLQLTFLEPSAKLITNYLHIC
jgi:hypothetical protein